MRGVLALLLLLVLVPVAAAAADPNLHVVKLHHDYAITGTTAAELRAVMDRIGPLDPAGFRNDARTDWSINWRYRYGTAAGKCAIASVSVDVRIVFRFPGWRRTAGVPGALVQRWNRYLDALRRHENGHAAHAVVDGTRILADIRRLAPRSSCADLDRAANAAGRAEIRSGNAWDIAYDRRTHHGATQGAVFP